MSAGWWFVGSTLVGGLGTAVLIAIGNSDGRSRFGRWWAGTPKPKRDPACRDCGNPVQSADECRISGLCLFCLNGPVPNNPSATSPVELSTVANDRSVRSAVSTNAPYETLETGLSTDANGSSARPSPLVGQGADSVVILTNQRVMTPDAADALALALVRAADRVRQSVEAERG